MREYAPQIPGRDFSGKPSVRRSGFSTLPVQSVAGGLKLLLLISLALSAAVGCSRHRTVSRPAGISEKEKNERVFRTNEEAVKAGVYEEFVDSMQLKGLPARELPREPAGRAVPPAREPAEVPASGAVSPETVMGYRVQLGAFNEQEYAERFAGRARERLASFTVYVRYYHPLWKVQVGDCRTREEAERLCDTLRGRGFPDAWVIQSGIQR